MHLLKKWISDSYVWIVNFCKMNKYWSTDITFIQFTVRQADFSVSFSINGKKRLYFYYNIIVY